VRTEKRLLRFLKMRMALLGMTSAVIAIGILGLVDLLSTAAVDALPVYVHITVGAIVFPVTVFLFDYHGAETLDAVRFGAVGGVGSVILLLFISEGAGSMISGSAGISVPVLFYVATVSIVASTVIVVWVDRVYLDVPSGRSARSSVLGRK
jgi:hypothetical protein